VRLYGIRCGTCRSVSSPLPDGLRCGCGAVLIPDVCRDREGRLVLAPPYVALVLVGAR